MICGSPLRCLAMKNGLGQAVMVMDMLFADGPYSRVAEDFLSGCCSGCRGFDLDDMRFDAGRFLCRDCLSLQYAA